MKNITIGHTGADWRVAASARYYAERGDGEEYAFGATPTEALANLEKRESVKVPKFYENLSDEIAFLALGAAVFLRENRIADFERFDGYMGFIGRVIQHAPLLASRWQQMDVGQFDGVWLYDVTERFGREWAELLVGGGDTSPEVLLEQIISDELAKWE
ncbi:MAG: hypothetical protein KGK05_02480 [Xanthomonadaceae bacterium]|nr:hypothetical protein [Xanthomonadaceae bacterium]MDE2256611.1 hypothetical protein [Xanthomonadaceae bacterium]